MDKISKIYIAGHQGMVGSAIFRKLSSEGYRKIVVRNSFDLDLRIQSKVSDFFSKEKPDYVFLAAAKVGGILANNIQRASFLYDNLMIQNNVIHESYKNEVKKLLFLGSSCIYPRLAPQPLEEEYLLSGYLETTNEPYAIAKIAGIKLCEAYRFEYNFKTLSIIPPNLYGPNDNYNLETSHVLPALIRKFHEAKKRGDDHVTLWGTGSPMREFMHVDDLADACYYLMQHFDEPGFVNVGTGEDLSIRDLALMVKKIIGFEGSIKHDLSKPDGTPRKLMDVSKLRAAGWNAKIGLEEGVSKVYASLSGEDWY